MKKSIVWHTIIALTSVAIFLILHQCLSILDKQFDGATLKLLIAILFPVFFGFFISLPIKKSDNSKLTIFWPKLLLQGIPAFILGIPFDALIFLYLRLTGINHVNTGILTYPFHFQSQFALLNMTFGVWFGKILCESILWPNSNNETVKKMFF